MAPSDSYFLTTDRVGFRPWREEDFPLAARLWGDPSVMDMIGGAYADDQVRERIRRETETLSELGVQYWPIFSLTTGEHIGCCGLRPWTYTVDRGGRELGFHLRPEFWGRGLAREVAAAAIGYGFETVGLPCILAGHHPNNHASAKVLLSLGFDPQPPVFYPPTGLMHPAYVLINPLGSGSEQRSYQQSR